MNKKYYQQLRHKIIKYKIIHPKKYLKHLDEKWCKLFTKTIKKTKEDIGWWQTKHITEFGVELNIGQEELPEDTIKFSDKDKLQHYLGQIFDSGLFTEEKMNNYEGLDEANSDYASSVLLCELYPMAISNRYHSHEYCSDRPLESHGTEHS